MSKSRSDTEVLSGPLDSSQPFVDGVVSLGTMPQPAAAHSGHAEGKHSARPGEETYSDESAAAEAGKSGPARRSRTHFLDKEHK